MAFPNLIIADKSLAITSFSQIIGSDEIETLAGGSIETIRPRHIRFYLHSDEEGYRWLMSNLSKSSPVKHNRKRVKRLQYVTIQDKDLIQLGTVTLKVNMTDAMIDEK